MTKVGFVGLTHLGIVSAAATAARGFEVIGFDPDETLVGRLSFGDPVILEPGLGDLLADRDLRLTFSARPVDLASCDVVYTSADVPTDESSQSDLSGIDTLIATVIGALGPKAVMVVLCQVPPGYTRIVRFDPARLFYQVETLIFGNAVERAIRPERVIVGCAHPDQSLPEPYRALLDAFECPVLTMRYESAELAKIAINCCLAAQIGVTNTLAELSEAIGADWMEIVPALRLDRRIGQHAYLTPGLGFSGGNLERDLATVLRLANQHGTGAGIVAAWRANSVWRKDWPYRVLRRSGLLERPDAAFAVLGLAYKENTHSTKNSPSLALIERLEGHRVKVHDPVVPAGTVSWAEAVDDPLAAATGADAVLLLTPWPQYRDLNPADLARVMRGRLLVDPYRLLADRDPREYGLEWWRLGAETFA